MQVHVQKGILARRPLAALGKLTVAALIGDALGFAVLLILIAIGGGGFITPLFIVAVALLISAGIVATGVNWTPLLGTLLGLGTLIGGVFTQQYFLYHLTHPAEGGPFIIALLMCLFALVVICTGIGATLQNYRSAERPAPRWLPIPLSVLGGFVLGALLVSLLVQGAPASISASANGVPVVHMEAGNFAQSSVTIAKGSKLLLIDDGNILHILRNGSWVNGQPHAAVELGAPVVNNVQVNGNSVEIGPFNTAGTFHIYCTVHQGMNLTIIVQ
jgi:hypothetical protein